MRKPPFFNKERENSNILTFSWKALIALSALCIALAIIALFAFRCARKNAINNVPEIWFDNLTDNDLLTDSETEALTGYVTTALFEPEKKINRLPQIISIDKVPRIVFISVSNGASAAKVFIGSGQGIGKAIKQALCKVNRIRETGFQPKWIKFDVVQRVFIQPPPDNNPPQFAGSLYGLAFNRRTGFAFLPQELVAYRLLDNQQELKLNYIKAYIEKRLLREMSVQRMGPINMTDVYRFSTSSFFSDGQKFFPLYRGHRIINDIRRDDLLLAAIYGGEYLTRNMGADGRFMYTYIPGIDRASDEYNILRHAGTIYSMIELYQVTEDEALLHAVERGIHYLLKSAIPWGAGSNRSLCIIEQGEIKLGGNALAAIALAKYSEVTGNRNYLSQIRALGKWIQSVQDESGQFIIHKQSYTDYKVHNFMSEYYPGEAILAMVRIYAVYPDKSLLDTAEKGAGYLINVRDKGLSKSEVLHDHWLLYALNDLYRYRDKKVYLDHAFLIANAIMHSQNRNPAYPDYVGSYYMSPGSTSTATRSEALCAAYLLARDFGFSAEAQNIMEAIKLGVTFQLQTQFRPESVLYLKNPQRCLGGIHRSLTNHEIRIDYIQHTLSSLLGLYRIMD
ncbi:MAG: hypothetical protein ACMUIP_00935 [bacterium]